MKRFYSCNKELLNWEIPNIPDHCIICNALIRINKSGLNFIQCLNCNYEILFISSRIRWIKVINKNKYAWFDLLDETMKCFWNSNFEFGNWTPGTHRLTIPDYLINPGTFSLTQLFNFLLKASM